MNYDERNERLFMLRLFKFSFQVVRIGLPDDLQAEHDKFPPEEPSYFTEPITKAVLFLMIDKFDHVDDIPSINSEEFSRIANELALHYEPDEFLKFCAWFTMKAAFEFVGGRLNSYKTVWTALENVFRGERRNGVFDESTWNLLDKVASRIVDDEVNNRRLPNFDPRAELNLDLENSFVLRAMQCVFKYYRKEMPVYYRDNIHVLDSRNYHLSRNVQKALYCLVSILSVPESTVGTDQLLRYYGNLPIDPFMEREFLEYCVCSTKKAINEYFYGDDPFIPMRTFESCLSMLRRVRQKGISIPWDKIESVAADILVDNECRVADRQIREQYFRDLEKKKKKIDESCETDTLESSGRTTPESVEMTTSESGEITTSDSGERTTQSSERTTPESDEMTTSESSEVTSDSSELVGSTPGQVVALKPGDKITSKPSNMMVTWKPLNFPNPFEAVLQNTFDMVIPKPVIPKPDIPEFFNNMAMQKPVLSNPFDLLIQKPVIPNPFGMLTQKPIIPNPFGLLTLKPDNVIAPKSCDINTPKLDYMDSLKPSDMTTLTPNENFKMKQDDNVNVKPGEMSTLRLEEATKRKLDETDSQKSDKMIETDEMDEHSEIKKQKWVEMPDSNERA